VPDRSPAGRTAGCIAVCAGAGGALGLLGFFASGRFSPNFLPLLVIWQAGMAFALTCCAEWSTDASKIAPLPATNQTAPLPVTSFFIITVLVALTGLGYSWLTVRQIQGKRTLTEWEEQNAAFVAAAPSRENLPPLSEQPLEDVFVPRISTLRLAGKGSVRREIPQHAPGPWSALPPEHFLYFGSYGLGTGITLWQYPTTEWARYQTRHVTGCSERVVGRHRVLSSTLESWWYSGTRVIRVSGQPADVDAFLTVYLEKYPSDVEAAFPLFSLLRRQ
jgi:hypothetical protein